MLEIQCGAHRFSSKSLPLEGEYKIMYSDLIVYVVLHDVLLENGSTLYGPVHTMIERL
jgi:hypothetical protein